MIKAGNERDCSIDILKGIGIALVLVAHSLGGYVHSFAYSFHMPLFFIVAGYFFKPQQSSKQLAKDAQRLLTPYFFTLILMLLIAFVEFLFNVENVKTPQYMLEALIYGNAAHHSGTILGDKAVCGSLWFLAALFWSKTIFNFLTLLKKSWHIGIASFSLGVLGYICGQYIVIPHSLLQGLCAIPFIFIGWQTRIHINIQDSLIKLKTSPLLKILLLACSLGWIVSTKIPSLNMALCSYKWFYIPNIICATTGTYVIYLFSHLFLKKIPLAKQSLSFLGANSIILVCFPVIESYFIPLKQILQNTPYSAYTILLCKLIWVTFSVILCFKVSFLKKIFGIK